METQNATAVILVRPDGAVILHHSDESPHLAGGSRIAAYGGQLGFDESPRDSAWRHLIDQANLDLSPEHLVFWRRYHRILPSSQLDFAVHYFVAHHIPMDPFEKAGGFAVIHNAIEATRLNLTPLTRRAVADYFLEQRKFAGARA